MSRISTNPKNNAKDIRVCIISWTGKHDKAKSIYKSLKDSVRKLTIIYSDEDPNFCFEDEYSSTKTSNELFWADKFKTSINMFTENVLLIIHADCDCENWELLFKKCGNAFSANEKLGIWSPQTTGTVFPGEITNILRSADEKLFYVAYIDGIVFAVNRKIGNRMKQLDYSKNIYGWGIDWFAAAYALSEGMALIMDNTISINHPIDRGYDSATALKKMKSFLDQMDLKERIQYGLILSHIKYKKALQSSQQTNNIALLEKKNSMPTTKVN